MELLKNILWEYRYIILWVISIIIMCCVMGWQWTKQQAYALMLKAKQLSKENILVNGQQQEEWAVRALYLLLKKLKIPFVTEDNLKPIIHALYLKAIDYLDDGKINNSL